MHAGQGSIPPSSEPYPVCVQLFVTTRAETFADSQAFELKRFNPVMAYTFLQSVRLMAARGELQPTFVLVIEPRRDNIKAVLNVSLMLVTSLAPKNRL